MTRRNFPEKRKGITSRQAKKKYAPCLRPSGATQRKICSPTSKTNPFSPQNRIFRTNWIMKKPRVRLSEISSKTNLKNSFVGDMLPVWETHPIVDFVSKLRPLTTSYTPYQPERSQGTLVTHWIYQCHFSALTGLRPSTLRFTIVLRPSSRRLPAPIRTSGRDGKILLAESLFDEDVEVLETLAKETQIRFSLAKIHPASGVLDFSSLETTDEDETVEYSAFVFPQVNKFGLLENADALTDFAREARHAFDRIDRPHAFGHRGLKPPSEFGDERVLISLREKPNTWPYPFFRRPEAGLFGCRFNEERKKDLRSTPGDTSAEPRM